jgi:hypothetical protein
MFIKILSRSNYDNFFCHELFKREKSRHAKFEGFDLSVDSNKTCCQESFMRQPALAVGMTIFGLGEAESRRIHSFDQFT